MIFNQRVKKGVGTLFIVGVTACLKDFIKGGK